MTTGTGSPWLMQEIDNMLVDRHAAAHIPDPQAVELGVDLVADPHRQDDDGNVRTLLRSATDVTPGSVVVIGTHTGRWLGRVLAWDFEVNAHDRIVTVDLLPVSPEAVQRAPSFSFLGDSAVERVLVAVDKCFDAVGHSLVMSAHQCFAR
jgi:hypothetical protein